MGGGESGFATPDPEDPNIVWSSASGSGARGGIVVRYNERNRQFRNVEVWPESTGGWPAEELRYRFQWTFPLLVSPHDRNTLYVTSQHVHRTTNGGQSWEEISPDLTTNDKSRQGISGGLTPDNIGVEYCCVIYAFDESPIEPGVFVAGSNDGLVHVSRDDGATWTNVTDNMPDLPPDGVVRGVDISRHEPGKAFVAIEHHQVGDFRPHVYRTRDYGESWTRIVEGIEDHPLSFTRSIHEDPVRDGLVYLGTENRVYVSFNDGDTWQLLRNNLPPAPMYGLVVQEHFNDLVVGTYGRGFWIMDDITPLQQMTDAVASSDVHLFEPRDAYRFHNRTSPQSPNIDMSQGANPPYGASINYWLGGDEAGEVTVRVADGSGEVVRTLSGSTDPGVNRVQWDLRYENTSQVRMRTTPLYADWVDLGPDRVRIRGGGIDVMVPPGSYTVTLEVDGGGARDAVTRRAEGPEFGWDRGRHPRPDRDDVCPERGLRRGGGRDQPDRVDPAAALRPEGGDGGAGRCRHRARGHSGPGCEADRGRGGVDPATHDGDRAGRRAVSGEGDRGSLGISRTGCGRRISGRRISSARCRRCCGRFCGTREGSWR